MEVLKSPRSKDQAENEVKVVQNDFSAGTYFDGPWSEIPDTALAEAENVKIFQKYLEGRTGTKEWSSVTYPFIPGRDTYEATKTGYIITITAGTAFTADDVDKWFIWPDGVNECIVEYIGPTQVKVGTNEVHAPATAGNPGKVRGQVNGMGWHEAMQKIVLFIDTRFFYTSADMASWTEIYRRCKDVPLDEVGDKFSYRGDCVYVFNSNGIFKLDLGAEIPEFWKINTATMYSAISTAGLTESEARRYGRRYLVGSGVRLAGEGYRDRTNATIQQEGGVFKPAPLRGNLDYTELFFAAEPGTGSYKELECGTAGNTDIMAWRAVTAGTFRITVSGYAPNIIINCATITAMADIATLINAQFALNYISAGWKCRYDSATNKFYFNSGTVNGSDVSALTSTVAWAGTVDISQPAWLNGRAGGVGVSVNTVLLNNLIDHVSVAVGEEQYTHIPVYSTKDTGSAAELTPGERDSNPNLNLYVWNMDVPACKAMTVTRDGAGVISAVHGYFERYDIGDQIRFGDAATDTILSLLNPVEVDGKEYFTKAQGAAGVKAQTAASFGATKRFQCTQAGTIVTKVAVVGEIGQFASTDVGKTIYWPDHEYSYVVEYIDASNVRVSKAKDRTQRGMAMIPFQRKVNDSTPDATIQARVKSYALGHRLWQELPTCNAGRVVPGFVFCGVRHMHTIYYSQVPTGKEYLAGLFNPAVQYEILNDRLIAFRDFPDVLALFCASSLKRIAINTTNSVTIPEVGEEIAIITGITEIDSEIGCVDFGSIQNIGDSKIVFVTNEPSVREFNGYQLGPNRIIANDMGLLRKRLLRLQPACASIYDPIEGFLLWGTEEAA